MTQKKLFSFRKDYGSDLYIIQSAVTGSIKIGRTSDLNARIEQLQTGCPHLLRILLHIQGQGSLEKYLHERLRYYRLRGNGEWFSEEGLPSLPDSLYEKIDLEILDWWRDPKYLPKSNLS